MMSLLTTVLAFMVATITAAPTMPRVSRAVNQVFEASRSLPIDYHEGVGWGVDAYRMYQGDGSIAAGWPAISGWVSYQQMFDYNAYEMKQACTNLGLKAGYDTTDEEIAMIWKGIDDVAMISGVDHRFILAIMMQESKGCVRIWTTANANPNPGLMQDHDGPNTCNSFGALEKPCPQGAISGMIQDGVGGTAVGDGLAAYLNQVVQRAKNVNIANMDGGNAQIYYQAARLYNSGSIEYSDLGVAFSSTSCYASDIANRLTGWMFAPSQCTL